MKLALALFSLMAMAACTSAPVDEAQWKHRPERQMSSEKSTPDFPPSYYYGQKDKFF